MARRTAAIKHYPEPNSVQPTTSTTRTTTVGIKINLEGVGDFVPVPNGHYPATFESFKFGKTKEKNDDKVDITFILTDEAPEEYIGRKFWQTFTFGEKALWAFKNFLIVLGAEPEQINGEFDVAEMLDEFKGTNVVLAISQETYQPAAGGESKVRNKIDEIKSADAALLI